MIGSIEVVISVAGADPDITLDGESDESGYLIERDGFGLIGRAWDRTTVSARGYHGEVMVDVRATNGTYQLPVRIVGSSVSQITSRRRALEAAVSQFAYVLTVTQDGITETWDAQPADWSSGGELMLDSGLSCWQMTLTIPVYPIPGV